MISTIRPMTVSALDKRDRITNMAITKPICIVEYCEKMGGVDLSDQDPISVVYEKLPGGIRNCSSIF